MSKYRELNAKPYTNEPLNIELDKKPFRPSKKFSPDKRLFRYFENRQILEQRLNDIAENQNHGSEVDENIERLRKNLDTEKSRILDKIIFPAMADLTYFLECISENDYLQVLFENDLKELFGIKRDPIENNRAFMFEALIVSLITWDPNAKESIKKDIKNFRLIFYDLLLKIIYYRSQEIVRSLFDSNDILKIALHDIGRAMAWTSTFGSYIEEEYYLGFDIKKYNRIKNKPNEKWTEEEKHFLKSHQTNYDKFLESCEKNRPKRTFLMSDYKFPIKT